MPTKRADNFNLIVMQQDCMFDYVLENVRVYDGTGLPGYTASVAISGEKISTVSRTPLSGEARFNLDGSGSCPLPWLRGHAHSRGRVRFH